MKMSLTFDAFKSDDAKQGDVVNKILEKFW